MSSVFQIRSFQPYGANYTGGVTVASDNIFNFLEMTGSSPDGRRNLPQVKIFNAENPTVVQTASYMAFDTRNPPNLRGIDVTAGSTDGRDY